MRDLNAHALKAMESVSGCFSKFQDPRQTILEILEILNFKLDYRHGIVTLFDQDSGELLVEVAYGLDQEKSKNICYHPGEGLTGLVMQSKSALVIRKISNDPRFLNKSNLYHPDDAFIGMPIELKGRVIGVLSFSLDAKERGLFDEHKKIAQIFANLIGSLLGRLTKVGKEDIISKRVKIQPKLKRHKSQSLVGASKVMEEIKESIQQVARWNSTVLIRGESGTGKELVAKAIHAHSPRSAGPFVKMNCAAIPDTLLESELFGYEPGAFTGAVKKRTGRFEQAHLGTLFLDEIGDTSMAFQAKLLRVLQEKQFERLGGEKTISVNVRIVTATNVDLEQAIEENRFREDLYYRLNVMTIFLPPLCERKEDIPFLAEHFLDQLSEECGHPLTISHGALESLQGCNWPGNVRQLANCLARAAMVSKGFHITENDMLCLSNQCSNNMRKLRSVHPIPTALAVPSDEKKDILEIGNDRERLITALERSGWVQAKAARILNMTPRQVAYRIKKMNIPMKQL